MHWALLYTGIRYPRVPTWALGKSIPPKLTSMTRIISGVTMPEASLTERARADSTEISETKTRMVDRITASRQA